MSKNVWNCNKYKTSVNAGHSPEVAYTCTVTEYKSIGKFKMNCIVKEKMERSKYTRSLSWLKLPLRERCTVCILEIQYQQLNKILVSAYNELHLCDFNISTKQFS